MESNTQVSSTTTKAGTLNSAQFKADLQLAEPSVTQSERFVNTELQQQPAHHLEQAQDTPESVILARQSEAKASKMVEEMLEQKATADSIILFKKGSLRVDQVSILKELLNEGRLRPECLPILRLALPEQLGQSLERPALMKKTLHTMLLECDNQRRAYAKLFLKDKKSKKHLLDQGDIKALDFLQEIVEISANAFKDPYGKEFYSEGLNRPASQHTGAERLSALYSTSQILVDPMSKWESTQMHIQPFKKDNFSFTTKNRGKITFRVSLDDFQPNSQLAMLTTTSQYVLKAGFFWFQRKEAFLVEGRVTFAIKTSDCLGFETVRYSEEFITNQIDKDGKFTFERNINGVRTDSGIYHGEGYQELDNPGVPGYSRHEECNFSKLLFSYNRKNLGHETHFSEATLTVEVESEANEDIDRIVGLTASPAITGVFFRVFTHET